MSFRISGHACLRQAQRGVSNKELAWLLLEADLERPAGRDAIFLCLSHQKRQSAPSDKIAKYGVVVGSCGSVITVMPIHMSRPAQRKTFH